MPVQSAAVMTREQITSVVSALSELLAVLRNARPEDKAAIYSELGLKLVYEPEGQLVRTEGGYDEPCSPLVFRKCPRSESNHSPTRACCPPFSTWAARDARGGRPADRSVAL
jgi:hypothetical protein